MTASTRPSPRAELEAWYRADEAKAMARLVALVQADASANRRIEAHAADLIALIRAEDSGSWQLRQLLRDYDLSTDEGVALMCLAEALLRVPDKATADRLIADKLSAANWSSHAGFDRPLFINAAAWALMLGKQTVAPAGDGQDHSFTGHHRLISRFGAPVVRTALRAAMKALGELFVFSETIENALQRTSQELGADQHYSFDMLGEAACTANQAEHFFAGYLHAIKQLEQGQTRLASPAISVKLSALHPGYRPQKRQAIVRDLYPKLLTLCQTAMRAGVNLCLDAEEADRLDLSLDLVEKLLEVPSLDGWEGLGIAVQAYQKRAYPLLVWLTRKAREAKRKLQVRLVKGAYWDAEIKACQVLGLSDFPVFTRKVNTDISYLACARYLLAQRDVLLPQFATHNAHTLASIIEMSRTQPGGFEMQRLHGMDDIVQQRISRDFGVPSRIYAPIGEHTHLLPYLVRRLLENGANSSFVNQVTRRDQSIDCLTRDPVAVFKGLPEARNPRIATPADIFMPERKNSCGVDFSEQAGVAALYAEMTDASDTWLPMNVHPLIAGAAAAGTGATPCRDQHSLAITNPAASQTVIGKVLSTSAEDAVQALQAAYQYAPVWAGASAKHRADLVDKVAELLQEQKPAFMALCIREAGKTIADAEAEVREAIDFCRYYACLARAHAEPLALPGSVGEHNELSWQGRGPFLCISPWNFPLAILTGQAMAALVSGNPVLLKPAEQTSLIAAAATQLFHRAGIPREAIQLIPGDGPTLAQLLLPRRELKGVAFTGSLAAARSIHLTLARRRDEIIPLIAETGGQNAMIVDATALPEQVVRDVLVSAFGSAGQRCSCLRILYIQDTIADTLLGLLKDAMAELQVGDPWQYASDIGPVISAQAARQLMDHIDKMQLVAQAVYSPPLPDGLPTGHFISPTLIELSDSRLLKGEIFGPILHVVRYSAEDIDRVIAAINATGFGLTLGIHSRIDTFSRYISDRVNVGNVYINRHMTGAVVGSQPFGGRGASGTGFKAGGPHYLYRFMTEKSVSIDTTAAGGNASLLGEG